MPTLSLILLLAAGILALPANAATPGIPQCIPLDRVMKCATQLSATEMMGRLTGAPSGQPCESYVEKAMRALPLEVHTQEFRFPLYELKTPIALALLDEKSSPTQVFHYIKDFREVDFSGSGKLDGDLVFLGFGIDEVGASPYERVDVSGKVAVILTGGPEGAKPEQVRMDRKLDAAAKHGAKGVLFIPTGRMAQAIAERGPEAKLWALDLKREFHPELYHPETPALFLHGHATKALLGHSPEDLAKEPLPRALGRRVRMELNGRVDREAKARNIIGILRGTDPNLAKEAVLVGAHYDHIGMGGDGRVFHGAADNAAGTALVLEAANAVTGAGIKPKRTLIFALWAAEEQGLFGSRHYAEQAPLHPLADTKLMIQLDYLGEKKGPGLSNVDQNPLVQAFAGAAIQSGRLHPLDWGGKGASDDVPFRQKGVPAYRFIAYGDHHHQDTDTAAHLNPEMLRTVGDILIQGLGAVAF